MSPEMVLGPLTAKEKDLARQVAEAVEAALASRSPAIVTEVMACLLASVMYDRVDRQDVEALMLSLVDHMMQRTVATVQEMEKLAREALAKQQGRR